MGEAKRKKERQAAQPRLSNEQLAALAEALRKVIGAVTPAYGKDCLHYAFVTAEVLRRRGFGARAVAGTASWRVGEGDGDVVSHAIPMGPSAAYAQGVLGMAPASAKALAFHAWVECGEDVVDFTTQLLPHKAKLIDDMDGQTTRVDWCPSWLWAPKSTVKTYSQVAQAPSGGVYSYLRDEALERIVFDDIDEVDVQDLANLVDVAVASPDVRVIGMGGGAPQDEHSARFMSSAQGLVPVDVDRYRPRGG